jgi:hypothetical protein
MAGQMLRYAQHDSNDGQILHFVQDDSNDEHSKT